MIPERTHTEELAWAAGFFDGEGSVSAFLDKRPGRTPKMELSIEQVDRRPLERFIQAVGHGTLSYRRPRAVTRQGLHRITMGDAPTRLVMAQLWPWLSELKREQYERCLNRLEDLRASQAA